MTSSKYWVEPSPEGEEEEAGLTAPALLPEADAAGTRAEEEEEEEEARECPAAANGTSQQGDTEVSGGGGRRQSLCPAGRSTRFDEEEEVTSPDRGPEEAAAAAERSSGRGSAEEEEEEEEEEGGRSSDGGPGMCLVERYFSAVSCNRRAPSRRLEELYYPDREREPRGPGPFYFFGGANGAEILSDYCESKGWRRTYDMRREDFKLKWCETKSPANYHSFREGKQLLFQIPNNKVLTTKIGLLCSLREYDRVSTKVNHGQGQRRLKMEDFFPATFRLDVKDEREAFFALQEGVSNRETRMWICKPTGLNQGRGIFLLRSQKDITTLRLMLRDLEDSQQHKMHLRQPQARIVQQYIQNPLLLKGRKFDVRSYLMIACTSPYMVFFRHGYVRLTCDRYDPNSNNLSAHLTNQCMQKKHPLYSLVKEDTVWSMETFNSYINDRFRAAKGLPLDWVMGAFAKRMQQIMTQCFLAVKSKLDRRLGIFDLFGCDFMVDEEFKITFIYPEIKVWLLEMNCNPALHTNCRVLKDVIPNAVVETLDLTLEIFNKSRRGQQILPLARQREFVLLFNGEAPPAASALPRRSKRKKGRNKLKRVSDEPKANKKTPNSAPVKCTQRKSRERSQIASTTASSATCVSRLPAASAEDSFNPDCSSAVSTAPVHHSAPTSEQHLSMQALRDLSAGPLVAPPRPHLVAKPVELPKHHHLPLRKSQSLQPRTELKLSKCTWLHACSGGAPPAVHLAPPESLRRTSDVKSPSTPSLSEVSRVSSRPSLSRTARSVWMESHDNRHGSDKQECGEAAKNPVVNLKDKIKP